MPPTSHTTPVAPGAPMPHRKVIRSWVVPISQRNTAVALLLSAIDYCLFGLGLAAIVWMPWMIGKILLVQVIVALSL